MPRKISPNALYWATKYREDAICADLAGEYRKPLADYIQSALDQADACAAADKQLTIEWQQMQINEFRRVLERVAKHADFSQSHPDLEDDVDRLLLGEGGPAS